MKRVIILCLISFSLFSSQLTIDADLSGYRILNLPFSESFTNEPASFLLRTKDDAFDTLFADSDTIVRELFPNEYEAFSIEAYSVSSVSALLPLYELSEQSRLAISLSPKWLRPQLEASLRELSLSGLDIPYSRLSSLRLCICAMRLLFSMLIFPKGV